MADKPARLFKFPWNDFRQSIGIFGQFEQVLVHQLIILFAGIGLIFSFAGKSLSAEDRKKLYSRLFLASLIGLHCIYMLFITVPRYNLTAMPVIILFAASGLIASFTFAISRKAPYLVPASALLVPLSALLVFLIARIPFAEPWQLSLYTKPSTFLMAVCLIKAFALLSLAFSLWKAIGTYSISTNTTAYSGTRFARILLIALLSVAAPAYCLPIRSHGPIWQWQVELNQKGQALERQITLSPKDLSDAQSRQCYLLIDSDGARALNNDITITVNGQTINGPIIPGLSLMDDQSNFKQQVNGGLYLEGGYIFDALTRASNCSNLDLRQWFLLPIEPALLNHVNPNQPLTIRVTHNGTETTNLFGSYQPNKTFLNLPSINLYSWEKAFYSVENDNGLTDTRYDIKVKTNSTGDTILKQGESTATIPGSLSLKLLLPVKAPAANPFLSSIKSYSIDNHTMVEGTACPTIAITGLPSATPNELWLVRLSGNYYATNGKISPSIKLSVISKETTGKTFTYTTPWTPQLLSRTQGGKSSESFDVAFPLNPSALPASLSSMSLNLSPSSAVLDKYNKPSHISEAGTFKNLAITIYKLPIVPVSPGWNIF